MATQLVKLPDVERLSPQVIRILGGNPGKFTLQGTNTYLLGTGSRRLLVDTAQGVPAWKSSLSSVLASEKATVSSAIITHWHGDHNGGIADLRSLCPDVKVYKYPHSTDSGESPLDDGQELGVDGATVTAHHTPGHTEDHLCLLLKEEQALFTGDNVLGQGTTVFEDLATYLVSLGKMLALDPICGYPAHGPLIPDAKAKITEYIQHRQDRENQILAVLRSNGGQPKTSMEIVRVIYKDYPEDLYEAAERGVIQVLKKLEDDGIVAEENGRWKLINEPANVNQSGGNGRGSVL